MAVKLEHKHQLLVPLKMPDGEIIDNLVIPRPKAKQLRRIKGADLGLGEIVDLIAELCALPKSVADELDGADLMALGEALMGFLEHRQPKSETEPS